MAERVYYLSIKSNEIECFFRSKKQIKAGTETPRGEVITVSRAKALAEIFDFDLAKIPEIPESEAIPPQVKGKGTAWYGETVAARVPKAWIKDIRRCMVLGVIPDFDPKPKKAPANPQKVRSNISATAPARHSPELIKAALALHEQGLKGKALLAELEKRGFENLPSASNLSRTLKKWQDLKI